MIRRIFTLAALGLVLLVGAAPAAYAQAYGGGTVGGDSTTISGHICEGENGAAVGAPVDIFIDGVFFVRVFTDSNGDFTASVPSDLADGTHQIEAVAFGGTCVLATEITVGGGAPLPRTGSNDTLPLSRIGLGAVAVGALLVLVSRKQRAAADRKVDASV